MSTVLSCDKGSAFEGVDSARLLHALQQKNTTMTMISNRAAPPPAAPPMMAASIATGPLLLLAGASAVSCAESGTDSTDEIDAVAVSSGDGGNVIRLSLELT